jgi:hypothetical protein
MWSRLLRCASKIPAVFVAGAMLCGCGAGSQFAFGAKQPLTDAPLRSATRLNLYVADYGNGTVTVYAPGGEKPLRTISHRLQAPYALTFDGSGSLFVGNLSPVDPNVRVYASGQGRVLRTINRGVGDPETLAFDPSGNLYVANFCCENRVAVYAPGSGNRCGRSPKASTSRMRWPLMAPATFLLQTSATAP